MLLTSETFLSPLEHGTGSSGSAEQESRDCPAASDLGTTANDIRDVIRVRMTLEDIREAMDALDVSEKYRLIWAAP